MFRKIFKIEFAASYKADSEDNKLNLEQSLYSFKYNGETLQIGKIFSQKHILKIEDISTFRIIEGEKELVSVSKAVVGSVLFGTTGAILGGLMGSKKFILQLEIKNYGTYFFQIEKLHLQFAKKAEKEISKSLSIN